MDDVDYDILGIYEEEAFDYEEDDGGVPDIDGSGVRSAIIKSSVLDGEADFDGTMPAAGRPRMDSSAPAAAIDMPPGDGGDDDDEFDLYGDVNIAPIRSFGPAAGSSTGTFRNGVAHAAAAAAAAAQQHVAAAGGGRQYVQYQHQAHQREQQPPHHDHTQSGSGTDQRRSVISAAPSSKKVAASSTQTSNGPSASAPEERSGFDPGGDSKGGAAGGPHASSSATAAVAGRALSSSQQALPEKGSQAKLSPQRSVGGDDGGAGAIGGGAGEEGTAAGSAAAEAEVAVAAAAAAAAGEGEREGEGEAEAEGGGGAAGAGGGETVVRRGDASRLGFAGAVANDDVARQGEAEEPTILFVGNLQWWTTDAELENILSEFGRLRFFRVIEDKASGVSKGYCVVEFESRTSAVDCKEKLHGKVINGRPAVVAFKSGMLRRENQNANHQQQQGAAPPAQQQHQHVQQPPQQAQQNSGVPHGGHHRPHPGSGGGGAGGVGGGAAGGGGGGGGAGPAQVEQKVVEDQAEKEQLGKEEEEGIVKGRSKWLLRRAEEEAKTEIWWAGCGAALFAKPFYCRKHRSVTQFDGGWIGLGVALRCSAPSLRRRKPWLTSDLHMRHGRCPGCVLAPFLLRTDEVYGVVSAAAGLVGSCQRDCSVPTLRTRSTATHGLQLVQSAGVLCRCSPRAGGEMCHSTGMLVHGNREEINLEVQSMGCTEMLAGYGGNEMLAGYGGGMRCWLAMVGMRCWLAMVGMRCWLAMVDMNEMLDGSAVYWLWGHEMLAGYGAH
ncbi:hypothetical protein CBR_g46583 [Chara braunii]|uniref:RRM domain-containing protein n=1 Tax=Chara braunii TaxID=69332 RepID=A0A388M0J6_CHABU|nr:hypothetical protein CBR_g46583 [Chara braunii]|eukprot:GBG88094.1 hypothetical protein CBR_g46583 [Chara braunii]